MSNTTDEEIQKKIYELLKKQPGIDRTKIAELLNLQIADVETSLQKLEKNNLILPIEEGGYTRFYHRPQQKNGKEQTTGETREKILTLITQNPGLHLSKIAELLTMSKPLAEYHLLRMEKERTIQVSKETGYKRYYIADEDIETTDKKILSLLRKDIPLKIVLFLANHKNAKHKDILQYLNIAPSTLSYHLNNLIKQGIILVHRYGDEKGYSLKNEKELMNFILKYRLHIVLDGFKDLWGDLHYKRW